MVDAILITVILVILGFIGMLAYTIWETKQYKYRFTIKQVTGTSKRVIFDKARLIKKDGLREYRLKKLKVNIPKETSPEVIEINNRGKICLTAYEIDGHYHYLIDATNESTIKAEFVKNGVSYHPVTSDTRELLVNRTKAALVRKKGDFWDKHAGAIILSGALVMLILGAMIFSGEVINPIKDLVGDATNKMQGYLKMQENITAMNLESTRMLHDVIGNTQIITGATE